MNDLFKYEYSELIDIDEVSDIVKVSPGRIRELCYQKKIPRIKTENNRVLFNKKEIIDWVKNGRPNIGKSDSIKFSSFSIDDSFINIKLKKGQSVIFQIDSIYDLIFKLIDAAIKKNGIKKTMVKVMFHFLKK